MEDTRKKLPSPQGFSHTKGKTKGSVVFITKKFFVTKVLNLTKRLEGTDRGGSNRPGTSLPRDLW